MRFHFGCEMALAKVVALPCPAMFSNSLEVIEGSATPGTRNSGAQVEFNQREFHLGFNLDANGFVPRKMDNKEVGQRPNCCSKIWQWCPALPAKARNLSDGVMAGSEFAIK